MADVEVRPWVWSRADGRFYCVLCGETFDTPDHDDHK